MKKLSLFFLALMYTALAMAQSSEFSYEQFVQGKDTLKYRLLLPQNFDPTKKYPVVFFLHGAGERGDDNEAQLLHGSKLFLNEQNRANFPAIVIFPQCPANDFWANVRMGQAGDDRFGFQKGGAPGPAMKVLLRLVDQYRKEKYTDNTRFYVAGLSMGGMGTLEMLRRKPRTFAAAISICGGDHVANVKKYKRVPLWLFHGDKDTVVPPEKSQVVASERERLNAPAQLTIYPGGTHNSWDPAFADPQFLLWLFSHQQ